MSDHISYSDSGVDIGEGAAAVGAIRDVVKSTYRPEVIGDLGGFGGLFSAGRIAAMEDPILVSGTDGVGTKLALARELGKHDTVGIDLVAMCVNDILCCGAEPLFFLDYLAVGKLDAARAAEIVSGIAEGCRQAGCALIGGEMAEHPGVMPADDYDLAGFCVGVLERSRMVDGRALADGDVILGLASSGLHSNGFSLVRKVVDASPELLTPTRIYVRPVLDALAAGLPIKAMAHITGGGITNNLDRSLVPGFDAVIDPASWPVPAVIQHVVDAAGLSPEEALATFNMGIGFALIVASDAADAAQAHFEAAGERIFRIGHVAAGGSQKVIYR